MQDNKRNDEEFEIDLRELFGALLSKAWIIIVCAFVMGIAGFAVSSFMMTPQYESTTKVYILNKASDKVTVSDTQLAAQLTKDYEQLIKSRTVLESVMKTCKVDGSYEGFAERIAIQTVADTRIISITVTDPDPKKAQVLANQVREVAAIHIKNVTDVEAVNVADEANLPMEPASPSIIKYTILGAVIGMVLSMGIIIVAFLLDDTIKTSDDIEKYLRLSTLALIPNEELERKANAKKNKKKNIDRDIDREAEEIIRSTKKRNGESRYFDDADEVEG